MGIHPITSRLFDHCGDKEKQIVWSRHVDRPSIATMKRILKSKESKILLTIFLVAVFLRFFGLNFGLPRLYLEDEEFFVQPALRVASGKLDPKWYGAPGQPIIYGTAAIFRVVNKTINLTEESSLPINLNYQSHITQFQAAGRALPALLGALTVIPIYLITSRWSKRAGLWASGLVATSFYLIDEAHIIRPDVAQTFFIVWMIYFGIRIFEEPKRWSLHVLLGVSFGLGITTKYPTLFFLVPLIAFLFVLQRTQKFSLFKWVSTGFVSLAAAFASGPYLFLRFQRVLHDVEIENRAAQSGHDQFNWLQNFWWYFSSVLHFQLGTFIGILALITVGLLVRQILKNRNDRRLLMFLFIASTTLVYLILLSFLRLHWERWMIPCLTLAFILAGISIDWLFRLRLQRVVMWSLLVLVMIAPSLRLGRILFGYSRPETREIARDWVLKTVNPGTGIVREPYSPLIPEDQYRVFTVPNLSWHDRKYYLAQNADFFITSSEIYSRIQEEAELLGPDSDFGKAIQRYEEIFRTSTEVQSFLPNKRYSAEQLLSSSDFSAMRTLDLTVLRGPEIRIFHF